MEAKPNAVESDPLLKPLRSNVSTTQLDTSASWSSFAEDLGSKFLGAIFIEKSLFMAFTYNLAGNAGRYMFREYSVQATQLQLYTMVINSPVAMQPVLCLVSDHYPIFGYHKAPYMIGSILLGSSAAFVMGAVPYAKLSILAAVACMTAIKAQWSFCGLLGESFVTERMQKIPRQAVNLAFFIKVGTTALGLVGSISCGFILEWYGPKVIYLVSSPFFLCPIVPVVLGWFGEQPVEDGDSSTSMAPCHQAMHHTAWHISDGGLLILVVAIMFADPLACSCTCMLVMVLVCISLYWNLPLEMAHYFVFIVCSSAVNVSYAGARYYFLTDSKDEFPRGPHFSPLFYVTTMRALSMLFSLVGLILYVRNLRDWSFRGVLFLATVAHVFGKLVDVVLFLNTFGSHIPDRWLLFGEDFIAPTVEAFRAIPAFLLVARLSPEGMEVIMNGLQAGCLFVGTAVSECYGALLLASLGCDPKGADDEEAAFQRLWLAPLFSAALYAAVGIGMLWMVPEGGPQDMRPLECTPKDTRNDLETC